MLGMQRNTGKGSHLSILQAKGSPKMEGEEGQLQAEMRQLVQQYVKRNQFTILKKVIEFLIEEIVTPVNVSRAKAEGCTVRESLKLKKWVGRNAQKSFSQMLSHGNQEQILRAEQIVHLHENNSLLRKENEAWGGRAGVLQRRGEDLLNVLTLVSARLHEQKQNHEALKQAHQAVLSENERFRKKSIGCQTGCQTEGESGYVEQISKLKNELRVYKAINNSHCRLSTTLSRKLLDCSMVKHMEQTFDQSCTELFQKGSEKSSLLE